jgi:Protein of unknown function (DUF2865)
MLNSRHISIGLAVLAAIALAPAPASAQGLFDLFFGGAQHPTPLPSASAYADPTQNVGRPNDTGPRVETGPAVSYCVRLCDGRFFPIQRSAATPVEVCNSFCPAAKTKVFSGGGIEHAIAHDGTRYADLANAFVYRTKIVPGCTCNGKDAFGLVNTMKAAEDPTLHQGDVVATADGFVAYSGGNKRGDFTPIEAASSPTRVSSEVRRQLTQTKIAPGNAPASEPVNASGAARDGNDRQAQLTR